MSITPLPSAPAVTDTTSEFNTKAFNWVAALDPFTTEANALLETCEDAAATAGAAIALVGSEVWVSGTTYAIGDAVYSPIDLQTYKRKTNGAGTTDPSIDSTNWARISLADTPNVIKAVASGTLDNGDTVVINTDGTVSIVEQVQSFSFGSEATAQSANFYDAKIAYDNINGKVLIVTSDGASNDGWAIVGTVSGSSISFGTLASFSSAITHPSVCFDSTAQKFVIAYRHYSSGTGRSIIATVSGTSVTFGSFVQFSASDVDNINAVYDSTSNKTVISYAIRSNGYGYSIVGTVSGTSISYGTAVAFRSAQTYYLKSTFDSTNSKIVNAYSDWNGSIGNHGAAIVGTVSGTSISFGTAVSWVVTTINDGIGISHDSSNNKIVISFSDNADSNKGKATVGTVSGTSISFGSIFVFNNASTNSVNSCYDSINKQVIIVFKDVGNSNKGTAVAATVSGSSLSFTTETLFLNNTVIAGSISSVYDTINNKVVICYGFTNVKAVVGTTPYTTLTSENFIGFSFGNYTNGQTATIQISGAINEAQTGLTPGQSYYVLNNGSLSTTAGTTSVFAGTAIASTKLIVKG